ncbi:hypothetical protein ACM66B_003241 [Microbotryomycetes sp. NB124-2]
MPDTDNVGPLPRSDHNLRDLAEHTELGKKRDAINTMIRYHNFSSQKLGAAVPRISVFMESARQIINEPSTDTLRWIGNRDQQMLAKDFVDQDIFQELVISSERINFTGREDVLRLFKEREALEKKIAHAIIDKLWQLDAWTPIQETFLELGGTITTVVVAYHAWRLHWTWLHIHVATSSQGLTEAQITDCWYGALTTTGSMSLMTCKKKLLEQGRRTPCDSDSVTAFAFQVLPKSRSKMHCLRLIPSASTMAKHIIGGIALNSILRPMHFRTPGQ